MPADIQNTSAPLAEISHGPSAFEAFLDRNQKGIVVVAILLALGTAAFVVYQGIEKSRQKTAGEAFSKADELAALQTVTTEHAGTNAAQSATVLLADRQWEEGQQDAAIETLRSFISSNPDHPALPAAQASLGAKLMTQGKNDDAIKVFRDLVDDPSARYIAPYALISLGDIALSAGDLEKAEIAYNRVKADFSEIEFVETATSRLAALNAKAPVEVEPPPTADVNPTTDSSTATETPVATEEIAPTEEAPATVPAPEPTSPESGNENLSDETPADPNP